jgi:hypothetical protein
MRGLSAVRRMFSNRSVAVAQLGFVLFAIVLHGSWVAVLVYAFDQGGVGEAGFVSLAVLVPASLAGPFVAVGFDRLAPNRGLAAGYALQALALGVISVAIGSELHSAIVYGAIAAFVVSQTASRPTLSSILPRIVRDPVELVAANSALGLGDTVGLFLGPALIGFVLFAVDTLAAPFVASAILMAAAAASALTIGANVQEFEGEELLAGSITREVRDGLTLLRQEAAPRQLVILFGAGRLIIGALEVGVVVIAIDHLGRSEATAGLLGSAIGVGAILGAVLCFGLVGRRRLSMPMAGGVLLAGLPVVAIAATTSLPLVVLLLALFGIGRPMLEVSGRTLLQGLSADDTLARIFGFLEGASLLALALGSIGFSQLVVATSLTTSLVICGLLPPTVLLVLFVKLRRIDAARPAINPHLLALVQRVPIFSPLPAFRLEQMMLNMGGVSAQPNEVVFSQGDEGDLLYVVSEGSAVVELETGPIERATGAFFGEIALIRDQPRMATVRAGDGGMEAYTLDRAVFLDAISETQRSSSRARTIVERRLGET